MSKCAYCLSDLVGPSYPRVHVFVGSPSFCDRICCRQYLAEGGPEQPSAQRTVGKVRPENWAPSIREWLYD